MEVVAPLENDPILWGKSQRMYTHLYYFVWKVTHDLHTPLLLCMGSHKGCTHTSATLYRKSHMVYTHLCYCGSHTVYTHTSVTLYGKSQRMYTHLYYFVWAIHTGCKPTSASLYGKSHRMHTHFWYFVKEVKHKLHTLLLLCMGSLKGCTHTSASLCGKSYRIYKLLHYAV